MTRVLVYFLGISLLGSVQFSSAQNASSSSPQMPPNTIEERVRACVSCHGETGRGISNVYFPRLAGKQAGYLYNQLVAFRDGRRKYAPMNFLLAYLPDEYLKAMAQYYADAKVPFDRPGPPSVSDAVLQQGRNLVTNGNPDKQIPACVACHGQNLTGREPGIPSLIGMRADYISAQLGAWRYGTRQGQRLSGASGRWPPSQGTH